MDKKFIKRTVNEMKTTELTLSQTGQSDTDSGKLTQSADPFALSYHLMHPGGDSAPGDPNAAFYLDGTCHLHYILAHPWPATGRPERSRQGRGSFGGPDADAPPGVATDRKVWSRPAVEGWGRPPRGPPGRNKLPVRAGGRTK
jgi:hypothetical protein